MNKDGRALAQPYLCILLADRPTALSRRMHSAGFAALRLPYSYAACDVVDTDPAIAAIRVLGIRGASLTIPHKERALSLVDVRSPEAEAIGAINTIINDGNSLFGENTDWIGVMQALNEQGPSVRRNVAVIVGAGGAAKAGIYGLQRWGAQRIIVTNRNAERGRAAAAPFGVEFWEPEALRTIEGEVDVIVNATPVGSHLVSADGPAAIAEPLPLSTEVLERLNPKLVFDMVTRETPLLRWGAGRSAMTVAGSRMLLHQALAQFSLFTGEEAPRVVMEEALEAALRDAA